VLADIGDRQSIPNQLSTFSAHVLAISGMVVEATGESLILLDEIGSSTEPGEGAALGIAVLEHFRGVGAWTVATTHYNRLKMYAETTEGVGNAAMEFDEETLEPTFRVIPGLAGQSSGLRIAERLRLAPELVEVARSRLDAGEVEAARFVDRLKARIAELEAERAVFEAERREFEAWRRETEAGIARERSERLRALEKRLDEMVGDIRRRAEDSLRGLGPAPRARFEAGLERAKSGARARLEAEALGKPEVAAPEAPPEAALEVGSRVRVVSLGVEGVVLGQAGRQVEVAVGRMKAQRPVGDLEVIGGAPKLPENVRFESASREAGASSELRVIGCTRDEALERLDKFLDDAFLTGYPSVRVIHGSGKGVLREAIRDFLRSHPHVSGFAAAPQEQGGAGVTEVRLES
jgi:DNA mismatch repair protein MutS2